MTVIGITGTDGAGEKVWDTFARSCLVFFKWTQKNTDNLYSFCKKRVKVSVPATESIVITHIAIW